MPVKYPCLLWVAFFSWIFPPQCRWFVPSNCVRPSGAGDFAHTTKKRREGGRTRGGGGGGVVEGGGHQPAAVSASGCGSTHITARTHMRLFSRPGQTGRRGVSQSVSQPAQQHRAAEKVPAAPLTPKLPEPLRVAAKMDV